MDPTQISAAAGLLNQRRRIKLLHTFCGRRVRLTDLEVPSMQTDAWFFRHSSHGP